MKTKRPESQVGSYFNALARKRYPKYSSEARGCIQEVSRSWNHSSYDRWATGGKAEAEASPEVFGWATCSMAMQSVGQWMWEEHVWGEISPVLDVSRCLNDIRLERFGSSGPHVEAQEGPGTRLIFVGWLWSSRSLGRVQGKGMRQAMGRPE